MKLIRKENGDYHLLINDEIKSLEEFNINKEDCDILTLGYSIEKMAEKAADEMEYDYDSPCSNVNDFIDGYIKGFKAHQELVKDKLSVNQVVDFYKWLKKSYGSIKPLEEAQIRHRTTPDKIVEMYLQTLKEQTEWNIEFVDGKIKLL